MTASSRIWYGKGPGVDRSGDALRHVNLAGTSRNGGVLALMGDDHTAESSTTAHQSEFAFRRRDDADPVAGRRAGDSRLRPLRLRPVALSPGVWVGLKLLKDTVESTASIDGSLDRVQPVAPTRFSSCRRAASTSVPRDPVLAQEERMQESKRDAMLAFIRANRLNRIITSGGADREDRRHHRRQVLSRRASGDGRSRHRRGEGQ